MIIEFEYDDKEIETKIDLKAWIKEALETFICGEVDEKFEVKKVRIVK